MSCITTLSSCFKEEPLNAECDIEQAFIPTAATGKNASSKPQIPYRT